MPLPRKLMICLAALFLLAGGALIIATSFQSGTAPASQESSNPTITVTDVASIAPHIAASPTAPTATPVATPPATENITAKVVVAVPPKVSYPASTLNIPSVGISTNIVSGGENNGSMVLPDSSLVAEFTGAAALSSPKGSTVIAGHVNFADGSDGALGPLYKVEVGSPIYATDASGKVHEYKVTESTVLHKQALPSKLFRTAGTKQLVVVTCGGALEYVNGVLVYTHNQVVTAELVA